MKKIFALLLALALLCSMAAVAFAADSYIITITAQGTDHIYEAYQVFSGELSADGKLSNVVWGNGVNGDALLAAMKADAELGETFDTCTDAASVAEVLSELSKQNKEAEIKRFADIVSKNLSDNKTLSAPVEDSTTTYTITVSEPGYYFVKDQDGSQEDHDAYTEFVLRVVKSVAVTAKMDIPTIEKKIEDTNDTTGETSTWQDSADHDIGDMIRYQITATLADNVSEYDAYWVKITDTMTKGLTYNGDANVYIDDVDKTSAFTLTPVTNEETGETVLTITCADVKAQGATNDSVIRVNYTCELNENAVIGAQGNPNTVYMEYSNNPNEEFGGEGGSETPEDTGETPTDTVIAFTYKVVIDKVDENEEALAGAEFTLEKLTYGEAEEGEEPEEIWTSVGEATLNEEKTSFTFVGLDDGTYRLTETVTPEGYNTIDPVTFTVTAEHEILADNPTLTSLSGDAVTGEITFTASEGTLSTTVVNNSGPILPGTGGMGTTLFYAIGGLLLVGAVVLLVTKRRVDAE